MYSHNICKFVSSSAQDTQEIACFVLESDQKTMKARTRLKAYHMFLVIHGEGDFELGGKEFLARTGMLVFGFLGEMFTVKREDQLQYMYIKFEGGRTETLLRRFDITAHNRIFTGFDGLVPMWSESLTRASEQNVDLAAESMLLYTFSRLSCEKREKNDLVERIIRMTEERFNDPALSLATLSDALAYNSKYVSSAFKKKMGVGYNEYLVSVRIKYAISLFDHGIDSVKNVAVLSGYSDPLYFSSVFKRRVGISPTEYIKNKVN